MRKLLHSFPLFGKILILRNVVLIQAVNVYAYDEELLKAIPDNFLLLRVSKERKVMRLEKCLASHIGLHLTASVDGLKVATGNAHGEDWAPNVLNSDCDNRYEQRNTEVIRALIYHALNILDS